MGGVRSFSDSLEMPFFYLPGNHDYSNDVMAKIWRDRIGPSYYSFVYRDVLFLCLNSMEEGDEELGDTQVQWVRERLEAHPDVRWTMVLLHHPLYTKDNAGWNDVSDALGDRKYTVIAGHWHSYTKYMRNDRKHITLATTGGGSQLRGPLYGEFDHVVWITMTDEGPRIANLMLEGIEDENVRTEEMELLLESLRGLVSVGPIHIDSEEPPAEAVAMIKVTNTTDAPVHIRARLTEAIGGRESLDLTVPAGQTELHELTIQSPEDYTVGEALPYFLRWTADTDSDLLGGRELTNDVALGLYRKWSIPRTETRIIADGLLDDWGELRFKPFQPLWDETFDTYDGEEDFSARFDVAYDDDFFYFVIEVIDDDIRADADHYPWLQDGIGLSFNARPEPQRDWSPANLGTYVEGSFFLGLSPGKDGPITFHGEDLTPEGATVTCVLNETGYVAEVAFPSDYLDDPQQAPWTAIRINVDVHDYDGEEEKLGVPTHGTQVIWRPWWHHKTCFPGSGTFYK